MSWTTASTKSILRRGMKELLAIPSMDKQLAGEIETTPKGLAK